MKKNKKDSLSVNWIHKFLKPMLLTALVSFVVSCVVFDIKEDEKQEKAELKEKQKESCNNIAGDLFLPREFGQMKTIYSTKMGKWVLACEIYIPPTTTTTSETYYFHIRSNDPTLEKIEDEVFEIANLRLKQIRYSKAIESEKGKNEAR